ncbi:MAG: ATP-dependent zinc metalloprotease FtsH [Eubacterium sp.]|nr:ATP-dependent zinc metalloprotease FtsH [Eubacterium sp.]MDD6568938.1 ATP-dependent zinc metalloprotease FtsH [Eubacteriales bacterium]MDY4110682.1 ATP-dependent zinc metalloprotease FtsH [Eubacterium sp.]
MNNMSKNWKSILVYILIPILLIGAVIYFVNSQSSTELKYSQVVSMFKNNEVSEFSLDLSSGNLVYKTFAKPKEEKTYSVPKVSYFLDDIRGSVDKYNEEHPDKPIVYDYKAGTSNAWLFSMIPSILMFVVLIALGIYAFRKMSGAMNNETNRTLGFGKIKTKTLVEDEKRKTTFKDVAGCDEEKAELEELVEFLKNPESFTELGARIPRGVLLVGPPGTGKTLLARAVAGEAGAPFLSISGSDFVEMYVGVGASRVRDLFEQAKKKAPAIVFIDEIDAVGRHRGAGTGGGNDEREQTLNQLLVEMDGFGTNSGIIVIAATNRPDVLDPALLRPGRFDRQITVNRPDAQGREDILKVHSRNKPLGPDVDLKEIAKDTIGFTGADLENLLNEAALLAVRRKKKALTMEEISDATSRVEMGTEKKSHKYSKKAKKLTAYHEAGHAVSSYYLKDHDPVKEISIIPRGMGAGGYTWYTPQEENYNSKADMLEDLVSLLGGRVAEALSLHDISTGASNDLQRATSICRDMVSKYGMSDELGPVVYSDDNNEVFLGKDYGHVNNYSEATSARIDEQIEKMMRSAYAKTEDILKTHYDKLELVAETLIEKEKISGNEFKQLMENGFIADNKADDKETENSEAEDKEAQNVDNENDSASNEQKD